MVLGDIHLQRGDLARADSAYSAALSIVQEHLGGRSRVDAYLYPRLAALRDLQHRAAEAAEFRKKSGGKVRSLAY
jgi:hypothetical protein